jgi:transcriptional regulator with XRE-family HTH domain
MPYDLRDQPIPIENVILHFGVDLRGVRLLRFTSQRRLSELSGVSQGVISMLENGLAEGARLETLARVAAGLHVDLLLRPCPHEPGTGHLVPTGRTRRMRGATRVPGTRRVEPGPHWKAPTW